MKTVRLRGLQSEAAGEKTKAGADSRSDHESNVRLELREIEQPVRKQPDEVLVRVLCIGLDGTDRELMTEKYGVPPKGESELTIGHESLGVVEEAGEESGLMRGDLVCALVRRPCKVPDCVNCRNGHADFCETGQYVERGIKGSHGYLSEFYVEEARYVIKVPKESLAYGVLTEPQSIVEKVWHEAQRIQQRLIWQPKTALVLGSGPLGLLAAFTCRCLGLDTVVWSMSPADGPAAELVRACGAEYRQAGSSDGAGAGKSAETLSGFLKQSGKRVDLIFECTGYSPLAFEGMTALGANGILALLGVTPGNRSLQIDTDHINQELVLENKCILGSVNASRKDFETGLYRLKLMEEKFPGLLDRLMTNRLRLEEVPDLDFKAIGIKAVVDVVPQSNWANLINEKAAPVTYSFSV
ncbi:alcohol dehydrogenase catalytic domain-containing protein [Paenibacillus sp. LMG 31456]|uniref:Alcohol dehydrogenase catalytic domain-containing protein n=1 Tax=Paenibacillus foliorum TaxID=2654974 RepID=A0A972GW50_9BACL|nr:glucose 1-dehydrogenase [Paenibacillus foliorum]NOU98006.1 alcohol dehydrogenase catalytic domain-containing protein [Paenibacillus foliorum]